MSCFPFSEAGLTTFVGLHGELHQKNLTKVLYFGPEISNHHFHTSLCHLAHPLDSLLGAILDGQIPDVQNNGSATDSYSFIFFMTFFLTTYYLHSFCFNTRKLVYHISLRHENITIHPAKIHNKFYYHNNGILSPKPELWILFISGSYPSNDHIIIIKAKPISYCNKYFDFHPNFLLLFLTELENFTLYP